MKLNRQYVEKPWGREKLSPLFDPPKNKRIGEVWFTAENDLPLLAKYIFTSEALSIQVHPNDDQARARGLPNGKAECWYILDAEPNSVLGLGLKLHVDDETLRSAALDGSLEQLMHWQSVHAGDFILVPPGTIHAIGAGISLLEFQQNADVTYRLYDYGRPRELHLDDGVAVATKRPYDLSLMRAVPAGATLSLVHGNEFKLNAGSSDTFQNQQRWIMPISGAVGFGDELAHAGEMVLAEPGQSVSYHEAWALTGATA